MTRVRRAHLVLMVMLIALLVSACQSAPVVVPVPVPNEPDPLPDPLPAAGAYLAEQAEQFQQGARLRIDKYLEKYRERGGKGVIGVYFAELDSGFTIGHEANKRLQLVGGEEIGYFNTASLAKLPMAFVALALDDSGAIDLDQPHYDAVTKRTWALRQLIDRMLTHSVNDYYNILLRMIGPATARETLTAFGISDTRLSRELQPAVGASDVNCMRRYGTLLAPRTTPADIGRLLTIIQTGEALTQKNNSALLESLRNTQFNSRIPAGINFAVPVAHKTGTSPEEKIYNDAAIVLVPDNPFVLVILAKGTASHVTRTMKELALSLYNYEQSRVKGGTAKRITEALAVVRSQAGKAATKEEEPMPEYDFRCPACGARFTAQSSMSDVLSVRCPHCGAVPERVFGAISFNRGTAAPAGCGGCANAMQCPSARRQ